jgi:hypothetical protein
MSDTFTMETTYNCYCDSDGRRISIGPDADGLNLVEIIDHGVVLGESPIRITVVPQHAHIIGTALIKAAADALKTRESQ